MERIDDVSKVLYILIKQEENDPRNNTKRMTRNHTNKSQPMRTEFQSMNIRENR